MAHSRLTPQTQAADARIQHQNAAPALSKYVVRQHPSGDRYIITSRRDPASPNRSMFSGDSARSGNTTPGPPSSSRSDSDYASYYSSWRALATSKTEQDAASIFLKSLKIGSESSFARVHSTVQSVPVRPKKQLSIKEKRQQHLERMKKSWGITDSSARMHNEMSAEDFLGGGRTNRSTQSHYSASKQSPHSRGSMKEWFGQAEENSDSRMEHVTSGHQNSRGVLPAAVRSSGNHYGNQKSSPLPKMRACSIPRYVDTSLDSSRDCTPRSTYERTPGRLSRNDMSRGSGDARQLAREARMALASLGIKRPGSTRSSIASGENSRISSPAGHCASRHFHDGSPGSNGGGKIEFFNNEIDYCDVIPEHNTGTTDMQEFFRPSVLVAKSNPGQDDGPQPVNGSPGRKAAASPAPSGASWDEELDELLQWTDGLGMAEI